LGDQTRPDANHTPVACSLVELVVQLGPLSVSHEVRHPETVAKARLQQFHGGPGLFVRRCSSVQNIREFNFSPQPTINTLHTYTYLQGMSNELKVKI